MKKYGKYYRASVHLDDKEYNQFIKSGLGVKKIFKAMLDALCPPNTMDESVGDGKNKSAIVLNVEEEI